MSDDLAHWKAVAAERGAALNAMRADRDRWRAKTEDLTRALTEAGTNAYRRGWRAGVAHEQSRQQESPAGETETEQETNQ